MSRAAADGFRPARWLPGRHLQTVFGPLLRRKLPLPLSRERWELADGDFVDADVLQPATPRADGAVLIALHGLEGSSQAAYLRGLLGQARALGFRAYALNFRSCSGEPNRLPRSYHSGETRDLDEAVRRVRAANPGAPLVLCGFSLGANVLVKWLGEEGERIPREVRAAAAISTPFDLALCARALDGPGLMAFVYRARFLRTLKRKALAKARRFPGALDARRLPALRTLLAFDDVVTAPLHGFRDARDYYARSSSAAFLGRVRIPLLLLSAEDDPFIPPEALPHDAARANPLVTLEVTREGGHVGFVVGGPLRPRYYAEERAASFLAARLADDPPRRGPSGP
ncbi:MAG: hydrolase [Myxococcales bacterium]